MYAKVVVNVETPLESAFHYHVPFDLRPQVRVGQLVEVEFGRRLAQGIIVDFDEDAPVEDTKPLIALIDHIPVVRDWQIELAYWMSERYLTALNQCLRLMLPPGLTRWADIIVDIDGGWDGSGRLTDVQAQLLGILRQEGALRGRKLRHALPKSLRPKMKSAVRQLVKRGILRQGTVLQTPRSRPKKIATAELVMDPERIRDQVVQLGRASKAADVLDLLARSEDPLPDEQFVLAESGATIKHLEGLEAEGLIERVAAATATVEGPTGEAVAIALPASVGLAIASRKVLGEILRLRRAEKYHLILQLLADAAQPLPLSEIYAKTEATRANLNRLEKLDLIRFRSEHVWRDSLADQDFVPAAAPKLTHDQARIWGRVKMAMINAEDDEEQPAAQRKILLHGVTGSGKTEIYMRAIDFAIAEGKTAIVLVPEIALTPQTVRRFAARFPGRVAIMHSGLSDGERYDTWRRARRGMFDIVIGPRSALFTPLANLGVVVVDEEHDESYKQTPPIPPPYYHAREAALALATTAPVTVILGSATPDLVTYHRARAGELQLLTLEKRIMGHRQRIDSQMARLGRATAYHETDEATDEALMIEMPPVQIVDLRQELRAGNRSIFSRALQEALDNVLEQREQAILFLNRRGAATYVFCRDCGHVMDCPNCDIPLTQHSTHGRLICHHCAYERQPPQSCPTCQSPRIKYFGLGTQQLETLVRERWPQARIVRWDRDTTQEVNSHDQLLAQFVEREADILIGTQMIAKGLDLPLVTLVGVISADVSLNLPDFRTGERAFQVLTQVSGRAGRGLLGGRVILQTYQPDHYAIVAASAHDYTEFYLEEIRYRTRHGYPPVRKLAKLVYADPSARRADDVARHLGAELRAHARELGMTATEILGPAPPFFSRVDRRYRQQILVLSSDPVALLRDFQIARGWSVDLAPASTL